MRLLDLTGQRFGRWIALYLSQRRDGKVFWWCRCDCGNEAAIMASSLRSSNSRSCGCLASEVAAAQMTIHGEAHSDNQSPEWRTWKKMKERCLDPNCPAYKDYGGRGIAICPEWLHGANGLSGFELFLAEVGRKPSAQHQIERKDNSRGYEPGNCKWATRAEQCRNRRSNQWVKVGDKMMITADALAHVPNGKVRFSKYKKRDNLSPQDAYERVLQRYAEHQKDVV